MCKWSVNSSMMSTISLRQSQDAFREALCDSFNTPEALNVLRDLVSRTNVYINSRGKDLEISVVVQVARWVGQMLRMFGLGEGETSEIGWGQDQDAGEGSVNVRPGIPTILDEAVHLTDGDRSEKRFSCLICARYLHSVMVCESWPLRMVTEP